MFYLDRPQLAHAGELNAISRSLCVLGIGLGKISVAFLIERFAGPSKWRKWLLRFISISIAVSATITVIMFYAQCQPVRAVWDKGLVKAGKAKCWDPTPLNTYVFPISGARSSYADLSYRWNQVIASRYKPARNFPELLVKRLILQTQLADLPCRLLGVLGLCSRHHTSRHNLEATIEYKEENGLEFTSFRRYLVSILHLKRKNEGVTNCCLVRVSAPL